ncbi:MAG: tyrosine--tRNA ligase [Clostridia bacterium]|nr:tyrosine--tRNA ligase [Clostridia bacterium]
MSDDKQKLQEIDNFLESLKKKAVSVYSYEGLEKKLKSGKQLIIKFGCDPSRPDLHLGHTVPLRQFKKFQELGHEIVFIIGDYTAMIGDPSGKSKTRPSLTYEQTRESGKTYYKQVTKILDPELTRIEYNSSWLSKLQFSDVLTLAGKYTVAQMLERDDFALRYKDKTPIGMHEFLYPLMQGYDSVAINADIEIGGTDQTFNLLVGRQLQRDYGQEPQEVITFPLLVGLDGKEKMSKSLDNYIGIDEPADVMFQKCMKVPDNVLLTYFNLTTDLKSDFYEKLIKEDIRKAHFVYAREIVSMYHGDKAIEQAEQKYLQIASGALPQQINELVVEETNLTIIEMLMKSGFVKSTSQARQLIQNNGVKVDNIVITDIKATFDIANNPILSKGKNNFVKFKN